MTDPLSPDISLSEITPKRNVPVVKPKAPARMGRKTTLTPEIIKEISDTLRICATMNDTASYLGVSYGTMQSWIRKGTELMMEVDATGRELDEVEQLFVNLSVEVEKARAEARIRAVGKIRSAMDGNWQAAAWYLERSNPKEWSRVSRTELTGLDGQAIQVDVDAVNRKLEALLQANIIDVEAIDDGDIVDGVVVGLGQDDANMSDTTSNEAKKAPHSHEPGKNSETPTTEIDTSVDDDSERTKQANVQSDATE